jgi:hypothetical protein
MMETETEGFEILRYGLRWESSTYDSGVSDARVDVSKGPVDPVAFNNVSEPLKI